MALPTSPSVVVLENDQSIYAPNVESSVVGIVGFADKGPVDTATLITSQNNLLNVFGKPNSSMPGQGLEGALEILETTNQVYFVRAASGESSASASISLGFCPAVHVSSVVNKFDSGSLIYTLTTNAGVTSTNTITIASSSDFDTLSEQLDNYFSPDLPDQDIFHVVDSTGKNYLVSKYAGTDARLSVSAPTGNFVFSAIDENGDPISTGAGNSVVASGGTFSNSLLVKFNSIYPGNAYNLSSLRDGTIQGISVEIDNTSLADTVTVNVDGAQRETFEVVLSPSSIKSIEYILNSDETVNRSDYVYCEILSGTSTHTSKDRFSDKEASSEVSLADGTTVTGTPRFVKLIEGTFGLAGGNSGWESLTSDQINTAIIGSQSLKSGMYALDDDSLNISVGVIPGITTQQVQNAFITLAETSKNFIAAVAPPDGLDTVQEAVDWINGKGNGRTSPINNSYAAVYWPWVQVFNYFAGADEWYDPSIFAIRQMTFTDSVAEPWFAPAGFRRGRLTKPVNVEIALNQGDKDVLYKNSINPVSKEAQLGITLMGQKTAQRTPSALDRVNVRRLMIYIRKVLLLLGKPFQFEPNDSLTWEQVQASINPFLSDLLARRAIVEGAVKCDSTTNTPLRVDRNELWCSVTIKPTKAAETIVFEVNLTNQSATING